VSQKARGSFAYLIPRTMLTEVVTIFLLAMPVASISWTVAREEVFREPREFCLRRSQQSKLLLVRKFFYLFTCEYCFSHYVTILLLAITGFKILFDDWRGFLIAGFSIVWIANAYMSLFLRLRAEIKVETLESKSKEAELKQ